MDTVLETNMRLKGTEVVLAIQSGLRATAQQGNTAQTLDTVTRQRNASANPGYAIPRSAILAPIFKQLQPPAAILPRYYKKAHEVLIKDP
jgi:hypothetical protein